MEKIKTINGMREALSKYFRDDTIQLNVFIQGKRTLNRNDTVGEITLAMNVACSILGNYEMMHCQMSTYEEKIDITDEAGVYTRPCIRCAIYVPQNNLDSNKS